MDHEYGKRCIESPIEIGGEVYGVRVALVCGHP